VLLLAIVPVHGQILSELATPPNGNNERAEVSQWIGLVKISIEYHSPNVHGGGGADRTGHIWGELVPYGFYDAGLGPSHAIPWRIGANETTTITFSHDVKVEGKDLKAGTYGLFLELEKNGPWTWIFSRNSTGWGSFQYDPKDDVLRVSAEAQDSPYTEFMTFGFDERRPDSALAYLQWEKKRVAFHISAPNINELYLAEIRQELQSWPGFRYQNWQAAAQFCLIHKMNLEEALVWADKAIHEPFRGVPGGRQDFSTLQTKAAILRALGRNQEADEVAKKAFELKSSDVIAVYRTGLVFLAAGQKDQAIATLEFNKKEHPDEKFWTRMGLAQVYGASGDKKAAIENWQEAIANVPEDMKPQVADMEKEVSRLKQSE
jgi:tetratricopeptide (TPR) repeat protein